MEAASVPVEQVREERKKHVPVEQVREERKKHVSDSNSTALQMEMYCHDLVEEARAGKLSTVICRVEEINRVADILFPSSRDKKNAILVGEPGVGKKAVVQGLALRIAEGNSSGLQDARLIALKMDRLGDGDGDADAEKRLRDVLNKEVREGQGKQVILFIENIHSVLGAGTTHGPIIAPNLMMTRQLLLDLCTGGQLRCIGSTTPENYRKYIDKDGDDVFNRLFEKVDVPELSVEDTIDVLRVHKDKLECDYGVRITDSALVNAARLTSTYDITKGRRLPDKAIAVVEKACAMVGSKPAEMYILEDKKTKLKAELRSLGKDKANTARRNEVSEQLFDLMKELKPYKEKKKRIHAYRKWRDEELSQLPESERRILLPSMLKNGSPDEVVIALTQHELREIIKQEKFLRFVESKLKEELNEENEKSKELWKKRQDALVKMREDLDKSKKMWNAFKKSCESTKLFEDVILALTVDYEQIEEVVSQQTKIPVRLRGLAQLHKRLVGQRREAVNAVVDAIVASRVGPHYRQHKQKPMGSFLFLGPTGVYKTQLAEALAEQLFDQQQLIRFDMSEYEEEHSVSRLIGAPPGGEYHEYGGLLTNSVLLKPYGVVLFDEVDKAHKQVLDILLQVLQDGILADAKGNKVDFTNTVIIMTSNLGMKEDYSKFVQNKNEDYSRKRKRDHDGESSMNKWQNIDMDEVNQHFGSELLDRLSSIVIFDRLSNEELRKSARRQIEGCFVDLGLTQLDVTDAAVDFILNQPEVKMYGARHVRRWIESKLRDQLMKPDGNCTVYIDAVAGKIKLDYKVKPSGENQVVSNAEDDEDYYSVEDEEHCSTDVDKELQAIIKAEGDKKEEHSLSKFHSIQLDTQNKKPMTDDEVETVFH